MRFNGNFGNYWLGNEFCPFSLKIEKCMDNDSRVLFLADQFRR